MFRLTSKKCVLYILQNCIYTDLQFAHFIIQTICFEANSKKLILIIFNFSQRILNKEMLTFKYFSGISSAVHCVVVTHVGTSTELLDDFIVSVNIWKQYVDPIK